MVERHHNDVRNPILHVTYGVTEVVNRMPLAGKAFITPLVKSATRESSPYAKRRKLIRAIALIPPFSALHLGQLIPAVQLLESYQMHNAMLSHPFDTSVVALYALANAGAIFAQSNIVLSLIGKLGANNAAIRNERNLYGKPTRSERRPTTSMTDTSNNLSPLQLLSYVGFTLGGQLLYALASSGRF